jgi:hypothetical protein
MTLCLNNIGIEQHQLSRELIHDDEMMMRPLTDSKPRKKERCNGHLARENITPLGKSCDSIVTSMTISK